MNVEWKVINFQGKFEFSIPACLIDVPGHGIDSSFAQWKGEKMTVYVDYGLFSDPLSKYANRSRYNLNYEEIDGQKAKTVVFDHEDGSHFVAVHFQELVERRYGKINKLTLIVEASVEVGREIPQQIIRSIRFLGGHNEH